VEILGHLGQRDVDDEQVEAREDNSGADDQQYDSRGAVTSLRPTS
jgi:hypothetical protein